ncbi:MAG: DUF3786 domain-containing protein [Clostridia bacterium]
MEQSHINPVNHKDEIPMQYYATRFQDAAPLTIAARCNVPYDPITQTFSLTLIGRTLRVAWPNFALLNADGTPVADVCARTSAAAKLLLIRYLLEGRDVSGTGKYLAYREMPWGDVYQANFQGRCIQRLAFSFGHKLSQFAAAMEQLGAEKIRFGDIGFDIQFLNCHRLRLALWAGDEEFPPSSQILFSDDFPFAFSAEDMAVVGDVIISTVKEMVESVTMVDKC